MIVAVQRRHIMSALIIAVAVLVAFASGRSAMAYSVQRDNAERIANLIPSDPLVRLAVVEAALNRGEIISPEQLADVGAQALAAQPLNTSAMRVLANRAEQSGDMVHSGRLIAFAERTTRRDLLIELALIERAVAKGSVPEAISHYDIALRTHPPAYQLLYPVLNGALAEPTIRVELARYLKSTAGWPVGFLRQALNTPGNAANVADIIVRAGVSQQPRIQSSLIGPSISALLNGGQYLALAEFLHKAPGLDGAVVENIGFDEASTNPLLADLAWQSVDAPGINATFESLKGGARQAQIVLAPSAFGPVLRRVVALRPGNYLMQEKGGATADTSLPQSWQITCLTPTRHPLASLTSSGAAADAGWRSIAVPAGCGWQEIRLVINANSAEQFSKFSSLGLRLRRQAGPLDKTHSESPSKQ